MVAGLKPPAAGGGIYYEEGSVKGYFGGRVVDTPSTRLIKEWREPERISDWVFEGGGCSGRHAAARN
jgi:hypothetical protein